MDVIRDTDTLRGHLQPLRQSGESLAFVPTMGNLHAGHAALVRHARSVATQVVVSVFVNPLQFGEDEDYTTYPSTLDADRNLLLELGTDVLFLPGVDDIYPGGPAHTATVVVPGLNAILEGEHRPTHFDGVSTVVAKLFGLVQPDVAVFGEKDYQQLLLIRKMVADLCMPIHIDAVETVREADGLAMSSRNSYLTPTERSTATRLYSTLAEIQAAAPETSDYATLEQTGVQRLQAAGFTPDYVSIRRARDLAEPTVGDRRLRVLAAAWLGKARLIDNLEITRG